MFKYHPVFESEHHDPFIVKVLISFLVVFSSCGGEVLFPIQFNYQAFGGTVEVGDVTANYPCGGMCARMSPGNRKLATETLLKRGGVRPSCGWDAGHCEGRGVVGVTYSFCPHLNGCPCADLVKPSQNFSQGFLDAKTCEQPVGHFQRIFKGLFNGSRIQRSSRLLKL